MAASPAAGTRPRATTASVLASWLHTGDPVLVDRPALVTSGPRPSELTFAGLERASAAVAAWLKGHGVGEGDRVVLVGPAGAGWVATFLGTLRRGAVAVPLDEKLTPDEVAPVWAASQPSALVAGAGSQRLMDEVVGPTGPVVPRLDLEAVTGLPDPGSSGREDAHRPDAAPAVVVWTSGTTGRPKGVTLSLANVAYVVGELVRGQGSGTGDRWLSLLPPSHMLELSCGILTPLASGSCVVFGATLLPHEVAGLVAEHHISRMLVVPMILRMLHRDARTRPGTAGSPLGRLQALYCGGAPLDPDLARSYEEAGVPVYQGYGLTETAPTVAMNTPGHNRLGSVGRPLPGTEVAIAADGEVLVRSPGVMLGYWDDEDATRGAVDGDGWLHTGDLGRLDDAGYLWITGRAKSTIVLDSGKKVQPEEVESALAGSDELAEACVLDWRATGGRWAGTEQVGAVVVPSPALAAAHPDPASLQEAVEDEVRRCTAGLAAYKRPVTVWVHTGELPRTPKRSVRRAELVRLLEGAATETGA